MRYDEDQPSMLEQVVVGIAILAVTLLAAIAFWKWFLDGLV